jgi:signal transduction histidine kinase
MHIGAALFTFAVPAFALSFSNPERLKPLYLLLLALPALAQVTLFDPAVFRFVHQLARGSSAPPDGLAVQRAWQNLAVVFRVINVTHYIGAGALLVRYYIKAPALRVVRIHSLYTLLCLLPAVTVFVLLFSWLPANLQVPTMLDNYYRYAVPDLLRVLRFIQIFPLITYAALALMALSLVRFHSAEYLGAKRNLHFRKRLDLANLGLRSFAHSLKNQLLNIEAELEFLQERVHDEESRYSLNLIHESCTNAFETIERGARQLEVASLDLRPLELPALVREVVARSTPRTWEGRIAVNAASERIAAYVDRGYFGDVLENIIQNAIEASGDDAFEKRIIISIGRESGWVEIAVRDHGSGIAEHERDQLFEPFFSTKANQMNWGIGLAFCRKIMLAHEGRIWLERGSGAGTVVRLSLPAVG